MSEKVRQIEEDRLSMISRMSQMVVNIPKKDITEVKSFGKPPVGVIETLQAVSILLGADDTSWSAMKKKLANCDVLKQQIAAVDPETIPEERRAKARDILNKYSEDRIRQISMATAFFYSWAKAVAEDLEP